MFVSIYMWIVLNHAWLASGMDGGSIIKLITEASLVVQLVMLLLILMSVMSWYIIGAKWQRLRAASGSNERFTELFLGHGQNHIWNAERLQGLYAQLAGYGNAPIARMFHAGYTELARLTGGQIGRGPDARPSQIPGGLDNVERAVNRSAEKELTALENKLQFLATTGSTGPFIGLFGTVWGIMNSFLAIRAQGNASLDVVGGDIAEALIATALGLFAAIPAVVAYNYFLRRIRVIESDIDAFRSDFLNIVRRHFLAE